MILRKELNTEKAFSAIAEYGLFYLPQPSGKPGSVSNKESPAVSRQDFFGVDNRFEISNLDLIRDMRKIITLG